MYLDAYYKAMNEACQAAQNTGPQWNILFIMALEIRGYRLQPVKHTQEEPPFRGAYLAPMPVEDAEHGWKLSWVVPKEKA